MKKLTNQQEFSRDGGLLLIGTTLAGLFGVFVGCQAEEILCPVEFLTGLSAFLLGTVYFVQFKLIWWARFCAAVLIWSGGGLMIGVLATVAILHFLILVSILTAGSFLVFALFLAIYSDLLEETGSLHWLAASLPLAWIFVVVGVRPEWNVEQLLLAFLLANLINFYWLRNWSEIYLDVMPAQLPKQMAVNLTAIWLYNLWLFRKGSIDDELARYQGL